MSEPLFQNRATLLKKLRLPEITDRDQIFPLVTEAIIRVKTKLIGILTQSVISDILLHPYTEDPTTEGGRRRRLAASLEYNMVLVRLARILPVRLGQFSSTDALEEWNTSELSFIFSSDTRQAVISDLETEINDLFSAVKNTQGVDTTAPSSGLTAGVVGEKYRAPQLGESVFGVRVPLSAEARENELLRNGYTKK